jgi:D-galactarolactone isomerase
MNCPDRMLWVTNWPHPTANSKPDNALLLDMLLDWIPDKATRQKVLVDNAPQLYGFC